MTKLREVIHLKAAIVGTLFLTALSGFIAESAESSVLSSGSGNSGLPPIHSGKTRHDAAGKYYADPPPGTFFDGRITVRFNRNRVLLVDEFGWFGAFSNQPETPPPDTGDGLFVEANTPFNLLPPNENLNFSVCNVQFGDPIGCDFDPFSPLETPTSSEPNNPPDLLPLQEDASPSLEDFLEEDDLFAVDFDFGEDGLTIDTEESFNFFGFSYLFNQEAFDDRVVGISLVEAGTGDLGLVPLEGFNSINCIPLGSPASDTATASCGESELPLDVQYITRSEVLAASEVPGFSFDPNTGQGTFATEVPFQLFSDPFKVDEPHNNLGLIALGTFGASFALKRRGKRRQNS